MVHDQAQILIVDDDPENGKFLEENLSATKGCKAVWFRDPRKALEQFRRHRYHVGILDLKMPHMSGVELFQQLREKDPEIGLVILTGYPSVDTALATLKTGAYDYLKKPCKIDDLKKTVQRILEGKGFSLDLQSVINQRIGRRIRDYRMRVRWTVTKLALKTQLS